MRYLLLLLTFSTAVYGQVTLNEISAVNNTTAEDLDGNSSDWIELANASTSIANIGGYFLTDDPTDLTKATAQVDELAQRWFRTALLVTN